MHRYLKRFVIFSTVTLMLSYVLINTFINSDLFKPIIIQKAEQLTGRRVSIENLSWNFYSPLAIEIDKIVINDPDLSSSKVLAEIDEAVVSVNLLSLLGKERLSKIELDIDHAKINYPNKNQESTPYHLYNVKVLANHIQQNEYFPLLIALELYRTKAYASYQFKLKSKVRWQRENNIVDLHPINFHLQSLENGKEIVSNLDGDMSINLANKTLTCSDINGNIANLQLTGMLSASLLNNRPQVSGQVSLYLVDVVQFLQATYKPVLRDAKNFSGQLKFIWNDNNKKVQAELNMAEAEVGTTHLSDVGLQIDYQNDLLHIYSAKARLNGGTLEGSAVANLKLPSSPISLAIKLDNVQIQPSNKIIDTNGHRVNLYGLASVNMLLNTSGRNKPDLFKNLNGKIHFNVANGTLVNIDLDYLIKQANTNTITLHDTRRTDFSLLKGSLLIQNGIINSQPLYIRSLNSEIRGKGEINLIRSTISYYLQSLPISNKSMAVAIKGSLKKQQVMKAAQW